MSRFCLYNLDVSVQLNLKIPQNDEKQKEQGEEEMQPFRGDKGGGW